MMKAPATGPNTVPRPPSSVIRTTSPDMLQCTSVSEASWNTIALVAPASPASAAECEQPRDNAQQGRAQPPGEDRQLERETPHLGGMRREISGHAEEHRVAE